MFARIIGALNRPPPPFGEHSHGLVIWPMLFVALVGWWGLVPTQWPPLVSVPFLGKAGVPSTLSIRGPKTSVLWRARLVCPHNPEPPRPSPVPAPSI